MSSRSLRLAVAAIACCLVAGRHHVAPLPTVPCVDLARDTCLPPEVFASLVEQARCLGFDVDRLVTR